MTTTAQKTQNLIAASEIFPLKIEQPNLMSFQLEPEVEKEVGNRLSHHFSRQFPNIIVVWHQGLFWVLGQLNQQLPSQDQWREALANIQDKVEDFKNSYWSFQWIPQPQKKPIVIAQLAFQVLRVHKPFKSVPVLSENQVEVRREADFWAETIEIENQAESALTLTIHSNFVFQETLAHFFENHPDRQYPEKILLGLKVKERESGSFGTIVQIGGTVGEHREQLIKKATGSISKEALKNTPNHQPLVGVQFGKSKKCFHYAMAALRPAVTSETAYQLGLEYNKLLKATKINYKDRQKLLIDYKQQASKSLVPYGFQVETSVNNYQHSKLFLSPKTPVNQTLLRFGNGVTGYQKEILKGLKKGGVYQRHQKFQHEEEINIAALKLCDFTVNPFLGKVQEYLKNYNFQSEIIDRKSYSVQDKKDVEVRAEIEEIVNELVEVEPDLVFIFLPQSDRNSDNEEGGSFYQNIYSQLLRRRIASQFIYDDTLKTAPPQYILNQVIPGILAKLGNLPFVLAEPLNIADYVIGLDISRSPKQNLPGTLNACASVRLYGQRGEFINYQLESDLIEGEEIPQRLLEKLLPKNKLGGKTILIYRDGRFCGQEVNNLLARAEVINAKLILVECRKSKNPRLYQLNQKQITAPEIGLSLRMSSREAILVTTKVSDNVGLARPLRLTICSEGHQVPIEDVVEATLKLTLLHHGALKTPRLPMPLHGSDRMAYLRLNGIYPSVLEGDCQFWL